MDGDSDGLRDDSPLALEVAEATAALWLAKWKSSAPTADEERRRCRPDDDDGKWLTPPTSSSSGHPGQPEVGVTMAAVERLSSGDVARPAPGRQCQLSTGLWWLLWPGWGAAELGLAKG